MKAKITDELRQKVWNRYQQELLAGRKQTALNALAKEFEVSRWAVGDIIAGRGKSNQEFLQNLNAGESVIGRSVLYDGQGNVKIQWVKTDQKKDAEAFKAVIQELAQDLPTFKPAPKPKLNTKESDYLAVYPMGDPHFGMLAWNEETQGGDFDLKIAEDDLCDAVERLVELGRGEEALIVNLGDFFHADNMDSRTWRSGHILDTDSRWLKMLRVGIRAMIRCIESALRQHRKVTVINAIGNHDDHSSMMLSTVLAHLFEKESRVNILDAPTIKHYYHFGRVLIGVHHGHSIKMADLPLQMATDRPEEWFGSKYRYWLTGHIHHDSKKEIRGVTMESFRTLAATDAYAAQQGYSSGRDMKCLVMHKDFGEVERHTVNVEMIGQLRAGKVLPKGKNKDAGKD
jgi:hypothetical protein